MTLLPTFTTLIVEVFVCDLCLNITSFAELGAVRSAAVAVSCAAVALPPLAPTLMTPMTPPVIIMR